jgi:outer membrane receptor protein involved in Fe transport
VATGSQVVVVRYMGYAETRQTVMVPAGGSATVTFRLLPEALTVAGIDVVGTRDGQARALQQQRSAANITNVVAADQIGRFPDANIGDAMKRIPGIAMAVDQGEARFGLIRGTEPRLNSITLNGERVPSAEAEVREVQLDLIPADMVQSIEVNKAVTPDMDADAIGASVNIVTRQDPPGRGFRHARERVQRPVRQTRWHWAASCTGTGSPTGASGSCVGLGLQPPARLGQHRGGLGPGTGGRAFIEEMDVRRYDVQRLRRSISASLDYRLSDVSSLNFRVMYNHRDDWENRFRLRYVLDEPDANGRQGASDGRPRGRPGCEVHAARGPAGSEPAGGGEHLLGGRLG